MRKPIQVQQIDPTFKGPFPCGKDIPDKKVYCITKKDNDIIIKDKKAMDDALTELVRIVDKFNTDPLGKLKQSKK